MLCCLCLDKVLVSECCRNLKCSGFKCAQRRLTRVCVCSCVSEGEKKQSSFSPPGEDKQGANGHSCVVMVMPDAKRNDGDMKLTTPAATKL